MSTPNAAIQWVKNGRIDIAVHQLRDDSGPALLVLHGLGESTQSRLDLVPSEWAGPVWGVDFTGHGQSGIPSGGGYTCEVLVADADRAVAEIGPCTVVGRGLGAYVGLLLAGARPQSILGVVLDDGPGLAGGGSDVLTPGGAVPADLLDDAAATRKTPDPFALFELSRDVRPSDYAVNFARYALESSPLEQPVAVAARVRPPWLVAVVDQPGVYEADAATALQRMHRERIALEG